MKLWVFATILTICGTAAFASCTSNDDNPAEKQPTIERIVERGKLLVGTTGDYRPLSYREADGNYWGFGMDSLSGKYFSASPALIRKIRSWVLFPLVVSW